MGRQRARRQSRLRCCGPSRATESADDDGHRDEDLFAVYAAGFDIGFRSALIEQCEAISAAAASEREPAS